METGPPLRIGVVLALMVGLAGLGVGVMTLRQENILLGVPMIVFALSLGIVTWVLVCSPPKRLH